MIAFVVISGVIILFVYRYQKEIGEGYEEVGRKAAPIRSQVLPVPQQFKDILQKYFRFYQQLSAPNKIKFERKVCYFIYRKQFIPRNVDEVSIEAKVLIAASAVQLTFGLPDLYLQHFNKILVYPNDYYSSITKRFHKGEVNPRFRVIVLSWQSFIDGYITPTDSINLGLHEMAHALRLENIIRNDEDDFFDEHLLEKFDELAQNICNNTQNWSESFFRPYACANVHEFFAVSVENFFERSEAFKQQIPELYDILSKLLNLDPLLLQETINSPRSLPSDPLS
ncbi:MAG TPA: zinc-dependent peptidase [Ohtaekwangia sp.]